MFENKTFEALMESALSRVSAAIDKREGSMVYNGNAPAIAELAQLYIGLDFVFQATYLATAPRDYLILRAADHGMYPSKASAAVFRAKFNIEVPIGSRFSCEDLNFIVTSRMETGEDTDTSVNYEVACETAGAAANDYTGALIPIDYIEGLTYAQLVELIIPGEDDEGTEVFRQRVLDGLRSQSFGGNVADYTEKCLAIDGVAAVKVHPVWNGSINPSALIPNSTVQSWYTSNINTLSGDVKDWLTAIYTAAVNKKITVGGTVRLVIMASNYSTPSTTLIDKVQTVIDPEQNAGEGVGLAPIGHVVTVEGVSLTTVNISANITYRTGWDWSTASSHITDIIDAYFTELAQDWAKTDQLIVRISQIESRILSQCPDIVADISDTTLNNTAANLVLGEDCIPIRGDVNG